MGSWVERMPNSGKLELEGARRSCSSLKPRRSGSIPTLKLEPKQLQSILQIEGSGVLEVLYLGYVEVHLRIPEVQAFDQDVLLLIIPNSAHTQYTPITLGTLHIDMAIKLATEEELKTLNKQW